MMFARHHRNATAPVANGADRKVMRTKEVFLASATLVTRRQIKAVAGTKRDWQNELWGFYDTIGEVRFAARWIANAVSRCQLYVGIQQNTTGEPVPVVVPADPADDDAETAAHRAACAVLAALYYGHVGQAEMLRKFALHLSVPGETYLVGIDPTEGTERAWYVASNEELKVNSRGEATFANPDTGLTMKLDPDVSTIIRLWVPHPLRGSEPDSPLAATLPVLREVKALSDHINATVESRLAGAGILVLPHSVSLVQGDADATGPGSETATADKFMSDLTDAMVTPLSNPNDASAVVPIVVRVPDEVVGNIQHLSFATELTGKASEMRKDAFERFAAGADLPREVVTGTGSANHWGAWQIEESSIKLHIAPLVSVICDALTQQYLWPALRTMGIADVERYTIWFDDAALHQRPNKSAEARELYNMGMLSPDALLRENGFSSDDAPTPDERRAWLAMRAALASPDMAARILAIDPGVLDTETNSDTPGPGQESAPRSLPETFEPTADTAPAPAAPVTAAAAPGDDARTWWVASIEQAVLRALDLAGGRLYKDTPRSARTETSPLRTVRRWDVHTVMDVTDDQADRALTGAFTTAEATFDDECTTRTVREYCTNLLVAGQPHRRLYLERALATAGCNPGHPRREAENAH